MVEVVELQSSISPRKFHQDLLGRAWAEGNSMLGDSQPYLALMVSSSAFFFVAKVLSWETFLNISTS